MKITKDALILAQALGSGGGITPTGNQDISTLAEYDVSTKATARVSADERAKIIPENIKKDVEVLGVTGTYSGGGASVPSNDVNFYDYDGTIVYSYSAADFANLSAMPANPTHEGLTAQGWNWTLSDAKTYVASYGMLDIGQMYITSDGKTRLYITIAAEVRMSPTIHFSQTVANGVTIDWGDGSATETVAGTGGKNKSHTYSAVGDYVITLNPAEGCTLGLGDGNVGILGLYNTDRVYTNMAKKVEIGGGVSSLPASAFRIHYSLACITIPDSVTSIGNYAFAESGVRHITLPSNTTTIGAYFCHKTYVLKSVSISNGVTAISQHVFENCGVLNRITIPNSALTAEDACFQGCCALAKITMPNSMTALGSYALYNCLSLATIAIPKDISTIKAATFYGCTGVKVFDFSQHTSVPTLSATSAFSSIASDYQILVPSALYDTWKAASNWSTYASKIVAV